MCNYTTKTVHHDFNSSNFKLKFVRAGTNSLAYMQAYRHSSEKCKHTLKATETCSFFPVKNKMAVSGKAPFVSIQYYTQPAFPGAPHSPEITSKARNSGPHTTVFPRSEAEKTR